MCLVDVYAFAMHSPIMYLTIVNHLFLQDVGLFCWVIEMPTLGSLRLFILQLSSFARLPWTFIIVSGQSRINSRTYEEQGINDEGSFNDL